jgi:hypothetical protein
MGANDASGKGLQYATKNRHQNKFPRKLWRINPGFLPQKSMFFQEVHVDLQLYVSNASSSTILIY